MDTLVDTLRLARSMYGEGDARSEWESAAELAAVTTFRAIPPPSDDEATGVSRNTARI